jgi:hypothetical protein
MYVVLLGDRRLDMKIRWTLHPDPPVDRARILDAYLAVAQSVAKASAQPPRLVAEGPDRGADVGYRACEETWECSVGDAALVWTLSPILASMGVSGEFISVQSRGLAVPVRGAALSSARRPGYASIECDDAAMGAVFAAAFGKWGMPNAARRLAVARDQLREELAFRTLPAEDLRDAVAELVAQRAADLPDWMSQLETLYAPQPHHQAAIAAMRQAIGT